MKDFDVNHTKCEATSEKAMCSVGSFIFQSIFIGNARVIDVAESDIMNGNHRFVARLPLHSAHLHDNHLVIVSHEDLPGENDFIRAAEMKFYPDRNDVVIRGVRTK